MVTLFQAPLNGVCPVGPDLKVPLLDATAELALSFQFVEERQAPNAISLAEREEEVILELSRWYGVFVRHRMVTRVTCRSGYEEVRFGQKTHVVVDCAHAEMLEVITEAVPIGIKGVSPEGSGGACRISLVRR